MQRQMAEEKRKREEETPQESIDISTVPYDAGESDEYVPLEYVEAGAAMLNDDDEDYVRYIKDCLLYTSVFLQWHLLLGGYSAQEISHYCCATKRA